MSAIEDARAFLEPWGDIPEAGVPRAVRVVRALIADREGPTAEMHQRELHHFETEQALTTILAIATKMHSQSWLMDLEQIADVARKAVS